jgi:hypothetical protein
MPLACPCKISSYILQDMVYRDTLTTSDVDGGVGSVGQTAGGVGATSMLMGGLA